jgi:hypothetical protein
MLPATPKPLLTMLVTTDLSLSVPGRVTVMVAEPLWGAGAGPEAWQPFPVAGAVVAKFNRPWPRGDNVIEVAEVAETAPATDQVASAWAASRGGSSTPRGQAVDQGGGPGGNAVRRVDLGAEHADATGY